MEFVLTRDQRDEVLKAAAAIGRQLTELDAKPRWQVLWVIGTNLTVIETQLTSLPRINSN